jgi:hypothetical protein
MWSTYFIESLWQYTINTQFKAIKADKFSFFQFPSFEFIQLCMQNDREKMRYVLFYIFLTPVANLA